MNTSKKSVSVGAITTFLEEHHSGQMDPFDQRDHLAVDRIQQKVGHTYRRNAPSRSLHDGTSQSDQLEGVGHIYQIGHSRGLVLVQGAGNDRSNSAQVPPDEHSDHTALFASSTPVQDNLSPSGLLARVSEREDPL